MQCVVCSLPFYKLVVPTVDTVRYTYLVSCLVSNNFPVMLVGPVGTGKTSVAQGVLSKLDPVTYSVLTVNLSAQVHTARLHRHHLWRNRGISCPEILEGRIQIVLYRFSEDGQKF